MRQKRTDGWTQKEADKDRYSDAKTHQTVGSKANQSRKDTKTHGRKCMDGRMDGPMEGKPSKQREIEKETEGHTDGDKAKHTKRDTKRLRDIRMETNPSTKRYTKRLRDIRMETKPSIQREIERDSRMIGRSLQRPIAARARRRLRKAAAVNKGSACDRIRL